MQIRFLSVLLLSCALPVLAHAEDGIAIRAGSHADHDRLVIDFPADVNEQLSGSGMDYQVIFDQPVTLEMPSMKGMKRITNVSQTGDTQLSIHVKAGQHLELSHLGHRLVIDAVADKDNAKEKSAVAKAPKSSPVQMAPWSENQDTGGPQPGVRQLAQQIQSGVAAMNAQSPVAAEKKPDAPKPEVKPTANSGPGGRPLTLAELAAQDADKANTKTDNKAADDKIAVPPTDADVQSFAALPTPLPTPTTVAQVKLEIPKNAKFAAFVRGRKFWIVVDQPTLAMPTDETDTDSNKFGPTSRYQIGQGTGTAYRIQLNDNEFPALTKSDDGVLLFTLYSEAPLVMPIGLPVEVENSPDTGPRLAINALGFAPPLPVSDPDIGDQLFVIPASADTGAVTNAHRWPQVETLPALHGVVLEPYIDNLMVDTTRKGVIIGRPPKGLTLSGVKGLVDRHDKGNGELIFDLQRWRISSFENFRRTRAGLESALVDVRGADRLEHMMQLARFLFAQGYPQEANGWLRVVGADFPTSVTVPEYVLLRGAVHVAMRDIFPADRDLSLPGYAYEPEVALWRGWAAAQNEDYPRARYFFGLARDLLNDYPDPYFKPITMSAAETALLTGDAVAGGALISRLDARKGLDAADKGELHYLRGLQARLNDQKTDATKEWEAAVKGPNKIYAAKAEVALVQDGLQQKTMKPDNAIKRLDRLRYAWRGDSTELATLMTLAPLYMNKQDARSAFECWQTIIRYFPNDAAAETARQNISSNLGTLFPPDAADIQKPIETLALYHDFINYAPSPAVKDDITRRLIDNLTALGLYHEAADIYLPLVKPQLDPNLPDSAAPLQPKIEDVFRLSGIYLLDGQTDAARGLLKDIDRPRLTLPQVDEYRLLMARADYQDNKLDDALVQLGDQNDANANRMRSDIYWRQQKWPEAAKILPSLLGDIKDNKLTDDQTRNILEQAVALSLSGDQPGLSALRERYAALMDQTDQAAAFRLVTLPPKGSEVQSVKSIQSRLGDVDGFASFLQGYRKLDPAKPDPAKTAPATAAPAKPAADPKK